ncbi:hypothetical protein QFC21_005539 [Naganishia friedmannii]|uniref:Uncharacterized protein n=1 Tax=Naganishia friedmannii TaxID=89922 RepID=A0ACC2V9L0_9TREE|nr:hypothetical protein QFC21_005539 [Naganishia friedmannii]
MDSYPWEPAQTTSGIVKDPSVGARLVPKSVRKDGSQRKELRIRDGYVPLEDRVAYKSRGKLEAERVKGFVPGASSATPSTYAIPSGKANDPTQGMSKAQKKNYQRKIKKLEEKTARNWDSEDDDEEEDDDDDDDDDNRRVYKAKDSSELNDRFDVIEDSDDEELDAAIDAIEIPELGVKPEFGVGFNKQRDMVKGSSRADTKSSGIARPPRPGGIFRDLGLKPKSSTSTSTLDTPSAETTGQPSSTASKPPAVTPPVTTTTKPTTSQSKRTIPGAVSKPSATSGKDSPRARPEVKVRPGHSLAGMMKQLAVQDTAPGVRR